MEGISKDRLLKLREHFNKDYSIVEAKVIQDLLNECRELNEPWILIDENTPKDRSLLVWSESSGFDVAYWSTSVWVERNGSWIASENRSDTIILRPTHWQELPNPPEVTTINKPEPPK